MPQFSWDSTSDNPEVADEFDPSRSITMYQLKSMASCALAFRAG
jgi:hypothetical protein